MSLKFKKINFTCYGNVLLLTIRKMTESRACCSSWYKHKENMGLVYLKLSHTYTQSQSQQVLTENYICNKMLYKKYEDLGFS